MKFISCVGLDLASKLDDLIGGQYVFVSNEGSISSISKYLNKSDLDKLKFNYAGLKVYIPMNVHNVELSLRNDKIKKMIESGVSINMVASNFKLSRRQIFRINNKA